MGTSAVMTSWATRSLAMRAMMPVPPHCFIFGTDLFVVARRDVKAPRAVQPRIAGNAEQKIAAEAARRFNQQRDFRDLAHGVPAGRVELISRVDVEPTCRKSRYVSIVSSSRCDQTSR